MAYYTHKLAASAAFAAGFIKIGWQQQISLRLQPSTRHWKAIKAN
jgi:hypothetical protein